MIVIINKFYRLNLLLRSKRYMRLLVFIVIFLLWLYQYRIIYKSQYSSLSCHKVSIYGQSNVKRCYPLLVNFADGCCQLSQEDNCKSGLDFGLKQCVKLNLSIFNSDRSFRQRNKDILRRHRGAGYWIWKSYILWHELYVARQGDIIVYSDAAVNFVADIHILFKHMKNEDILIFKQTNHSESSYTKRDAFILLNVDIPRFVHSMASVASYIIVRKSTESFSFISEWLTYCQDSRVLTNDPNLLGKSNYNGFIEHRHDQSILGLLSKKWNLTTYTDPSQWGENLKRPFPTIFQHHRNKN